MLQSCSSLSGVMEAANHVCCAKCKHVKHGASSKSHMSRCHKNWFLGAIVACVLVLCCVSCSASRKSVSENNADQIIGVWKPVSFEAQTIKIITKERFVWVNIRDNRIIFSLGGSYTFDGETYTENIEYGTSNNSRYFGSKSVFQVKFEGNKKYITGGTAIGTINEVWERVE